MLYCFKMLFLPTLTPMLADVVSFSGLLTPISRIPVIPACCQQRSEHPQCAGVRGEKLSALFRQNWAFKDTRQKIPFVNYLKLQDRDGDFLRSCSEVGTLEQQPECYGVAE